MLSIALVPFIFLRFFPFFGMQVNAFHLTAIPFMGFAIIAYDLNLKKIVKLKSFNILELFIVLFLLITIISWAFNSPSNKTLAFFIKTIFYATYFRFLYLTLLSMEENDRFKLLRTAASIGVLFFTLNFLIGLSIAKLQPDSATDIHCEKSANPYERYENIISSNSISQISPASPITPPSQARYVYDITVAALTSLDIFWPVKTLCYSKDIGLNALAGALLLFINILLFIPGQTKKIDQISLALCLGFIILMDSRATLILIALITLWKVFIISNSKLVLTGKVRQIIYAASLLGIVIFSWFILPLIWERIIQSSRVSQYISAIDVIMKSPFWGHGLGTKIYEGRHYVYPHNFLLASWLMMGISGLFIAAGMLVSLLLELVKSGYKALINLPNSTQFALAPAFIIAPIVTLMIRSSIESIFMLSDWISLAIFFSLARKMDKPRKDSRRN